MITAVVVTATAAIITIIAIIIVIITEVIKVQCLAAIDEPSLVRAVNGLLVHMKIRLIL